MAANQTFCVLLFTAVSPLCLPDPSHHLLPAAFTVLESSDAQARDEEGTGSKFLDPTIYLKEPGPR